MTTRQREGAGSRQTTSYRALIEIAKAVVASARVALDDTATMRGKVPLTALNIKALREEIAHYCALGARSTRRAAACLRAYRCLHRKRFIRSSSRTPT
jgi:hypothetical protein